MFGRLVSTAPGVIAILAGLYLLTTQTSDFFMRNGFRESPLSVLPPERQATYNPDRNSRVLSINL